MTLYKYYPASRIYVLQNELIRYTQPAFLNDPHEMRLNINQLVAEDKWGDIFESQWQGEVERIIEEKVPEFAHDAAWQFATQQKETQHHNFRAFIQALGPRIKDELEQKFEKLFRQEIGVLSLSETPENLLMWAHYGDSHRGFVIALDEQHATLNSRRSDSDEFYHPRQVLYSNDRPSRVLGELDGEDFLLNKSADWAYEREWRVIKPLTDASIEQEGNVFLFALPAEAVQGIILGANISHNDRTDLENLLRSDERYSHAWLKEAQLQSDVYGLRIATLPLREVVHDLHETIPVNIEGYPTEDECYRIGERVSESVKVFREYGLNFSRLVGIRITDQIEDIAAEIWGEEIRPYSRSTIVLGGTENEDFTVNLYIDSRLLDGFLDEEKDHFQEALHGIHKALVRVHDLTNRWKMFGNETLSKLQAPEGRRQYIENMVQGIWTDYIVSYLGASTAKAGFLTLVLQDAVHQTSYADEQIKHVIKEYRTHGDLNQLLRETLPNLNETLKSAGRLFGALHRVGSDLTEIDDPNANEIASSHSFESLRRIEGALIRLRKYYPEWEDKKAYVPLIDAVEQYALDHGLCFGDNEQGLWVAVL